MVFFCWASKANLGEREEKTDAPAPDKSEFFG
jgi:hypothetical protein